MQFIFFLSFIFSLPPFFCVGRRGGDMCVIVKCHSGLCLGVSKSCLWSLLQIFGCTREFIFVFRKQYWKTVPRGRLSWNKWFQVPALQCTACHCWKWHTELGRQTSDVGIGTALWAQSKQYFPSLSPQLHLVLPWGAGSEVTWQTALFTLCDTRTSLPSTVGSGAAWGNARLKPLGPLRWATLEAASWSLSLYSDFWQLPL